MLTRNDNNYVTQTGPGTPTGTLFRRFWLPALLPSELPEPDCPPIRLRLLSEDLVAWRNADGSVGVIQNACPHRGASLFFGRNEENGLRCVYHGWKFDVAGNCVDMPNEPAESNFKHKIRATAYAALERGGTIWVYMGPPDAQPEPPNFEWMRVADDHRYVGKYQVEANYLQVIEGSLDSSHLAFLHRGPSTIEHAETLAKRQAPRVEGIAADLRPHFSTKETDYGVVIAARRDAPNDQYYWRLTQMFLPSWAMIAGDGGAALSIVGTVPIDDANCWSWKVSWNPSQAWTAEQVADMAGGSKRRIGGITYAELTPGTLRPVANKTNDYRIDRHLQKTMNFTGIVGQSEQDLMAQEGMGSVMDRTREHLASSDLGIIAVRRRIINSARALEAGEAPYAAEHGEVYNVRSLAVSLPRDVSFEEAEAVRSGTAPVV